MARRDDIAAEAKDAALRKKLQDAFADLKRKQRFGLVVEEHIPETTALTVELWESLDHSPSTGRLRGVLHQRCNYFVGIVESLGPQSLARVPAAGPGLSLWRPFRKLALVDNARGARARAGLIGAGSLLALIAAARAVQGSFVLGGR